MAIRVYSDKTQKFYNTVEEANRAEFELKEQENREKIRKEREAAEAKAKKEQLAAERKADAEKVEAARKAMVDAQAAYKKELEAFCEKHGAYHFSLNNLDDVPHLLDVLNYAFSW